MTSSQSLGTHDWLSKTHPRSPFFSVFRRSVTQECYAPCEPAPHCNAATAIRLGGSWRQPCTYATSSWARRFAWTAQRHKQERSRVSIAPLEVLEVSPTAASSRPK